MERLKKQMNPNNLTSFLWGVALTLILFLVFINKGIENTEKKVSNSYIKGYNQCEKNEKI